MQKPDSNHKDVAGLRLALKGLHQAVVAALRKDRTAQTQSSEVTTAAEEVMKYVDAGAQNQLRDNEWDLSIEVAIEVLSNRPVPILTEPFPEEVDSLYKAEEICWEIIRTRSWHLDPPMAPEAELEWWEDPESPDYEPYRDDEYGEDRGTELILRALKKVITNVRNPKKSPFYGPSDVASYAVRSRDVSSRSRSWNLSSEYEPIIEYALLRVSAEAFPGDI